MFVKDRVPARMLLMDPQHLLARCSWTGSNTRSGMAVTKPTMENVSERASPYLLRQAILLAHP